MTIKEKLETIKGKKIAIWCEEEWMANKLYKELYKENEEESSDWKLYRTRTCIDLEETDTFCYCDTNWYLSNGFYLITYDKFIEDTIEFKPIELTQAYINQILNDKYGKDNWVIK